MRFGGASSDSRGVCCQPGLDHRFGVSKEHQRNNKQDSLADYDPIFHMGRMTGAALAGSVGKVSERREGVDACKERPLGI